MHTISEERRRAISRRVWAIWFIRKTPLPLSVAALFLLENYYVSIGHVMSGIQRSFDGASFSGLWSYVSSAVANAEFHVIVITSFLLAATVVLGHRLITRSFGGVLLLAQRVATLFARTSRTV